MSVETHVYKPAWKSYYKIILVMALIFIVACLVSFKIPMAGKTLGVLWLGVILVLLALFVHMAVNRAGVVLYVRPDEVAFNTGILNRKSVEISYQSLRTIDVSQTFAQRLFNLGTLSIASSGTSGYEIQVPTIPSPHAIRDKIQANERAVKNAAKNAAAPVAGEQQDA